MKISMNTILKVLVSLTFVIVAAIALSGRLANAEDKFVGKSWPATQRVSMDQIDLAPYDQMLKKYVDENGLVNYKSWQANSVDRTALQNYLVQLGKADSRKAATANRSRASRHGGSSSPATIPAPPGLNVAPRSISTVNYPQRPSAPQTCLLNHTERGW